MPRVPLPPDLPAFAGNPMTLSEASSHVNGQPPGWILQRWSTRGLVIAGHRHRFPSRDNGRGKPRTTCMAWIGRWNEWEEQLNRAADAREQQVRTRLREAIGV